jgi:hypothetical protein
MRSAPTTRTLTLRVQPGRDLLVEELDQLTRRLRDEIEVLRMGEARLLREEGAGPSANRREEAMTLGALTLAIPTQAVPRLIEFLQGWSFREDAHVAVDDITQAWADPRARG